MRLRERDSNVCFRRSGKKTKLTPTQINLTLTFVASSSIGDSEETRAQPWSREPKFFRRTDWRDPCLLGANP